MAYSLETLCLCKAKTRDKHDDIMGYYYHCGKTSYIIPVSTDTSCPATIVPIEVIPESVCRCTGIIDDCGTLIFEKDIVTYDSEHYEIIFESGAFALYDKEGYMIDKIGGDNDYCYPLLTLIDEHGWYDDCADDVHIIGKDA
ncbi:hypothetical protein J6A31_05810 [bacterium]|nr:hypothetical protein [bacterium]